AEETAATEEETGSRRRRRGRRGRGRTRSGEGDETNEGGEAAQASGASGASGAVAPTGLQQAPSRETAAGGEPSAPARTPAQRLEAAGAGEELDTAAGDAEPEAEAGPATSGSHRRRRRRRRAGSGAGAVEDLEPDQPATVVRVRAPRSRDNDQVRGFTGSTRLEAKRQRRREVRDQGRRRVPIVTEAEFLARREAVERVMVVRNAGERTQIAVLEDGMLVEHYVTRATATSYAGNVYLGRVQNVLPSMEAAFVDIGKGRNAVLYAGEVNYDASALDGRPPKIEQALKSGQSVVVQVTKDPIGHKGARLTSQVSLPGRYLVYVPGGASAGISRKLPDTERSRLKAILRRITPEDAGVIVRTAAEGASEEELARDIERLQGQWKDIQRNAGRATAPALLSAEPDLVVRVVRDIFNEDFTSLVVQGSGEWETIDSYVRAVAPDLAGRVVLHPSDEDVFAAHRVDEQLLKALDRKVWLPSGGSLILERTEAMTVIDVNTGRYTGKGSNLEETVTRNNLEAAEEVVRQLRLRDVGGIIVIDFVDMVLESNRELVLRRLTECLGRDRTKHQVAEITSLGLVQMTRKRVGQGLIEAFSETCPACAGRGLIISLDSSGPTKSRQLKRLPSGLIPQVLQAPEGAAPARAAGRGAAGLGGAGEAVGEGAGAAVPRESDAAPAADASEVSDIAGDDIEPVDLRRDPGDVVDSDPDSSGGDVVAVRRAPRRRSGRRAVTVPAGTTEQSSGPGPAMTGGDEEYGERPGADGAPPASS
ncbi:MAG: Rne/Rng family ribonuclease, partial [Frankiaceae bacterium]